MEKNAQKISEVPLDLDLAEIIRHISRESQALVAYAGSRSKITEDARKIELTAESVYEFVSRFEDQVGRRGRVQSCRDLFSKSSIGWCALERIARALPEEPYYEIYFSLEKIRDCTYRIQESRSRSIAVYGHTLMGLITQGKDCLEDLRSDPKIMVDVATLCRDAFELETPEWTTMNVLLQSIVRPKDVTPLDHANIEITDPSQLNRETPRA